MNTIDTMRQALEALEMSHDLDASGFTDFKKYGLTKDKDIAVKLNSAIIDLRLAIAGMEAQGPVGLGPEWTPCMKLPVVVHVRSQRPGEAHVSTREGITPVLPDDLIMRGVSGEEYPIGRKIFGQTYTLDTHPQPKAEQGENK